MQVSYISLNLLVLSLALFIDFVSSNFFGVYCLLGDFCYRYLLLIKQFPGRTIDWNFGSSELHRQAVHLNPCRIDCGLPLLCEKNTQIGKLICSLLYLKLIWRKFLIDDVKRHIGRRPYFERASPVLSFVILAFAMTGALAWQVTNH